MRHNHLTSNAVDSEIERTTREWLRLAPDRNGGRRRREAKRLIQSYSAGTPSVVLNPLLWQPQRDQQVAAEGKGGDGSIENSNGD